MKNKINTPKEVDEFWQKKIASRVIQTESETHKQVATGKIKLNFELTLKELAALKKERLWRYRKLFNKGMFGLYN